MKKSSVILMFTGAVLMAVLMFVDMNLSFVAWASAFIFSMALAATGSILGVIYYAKELKADKLRKEQAKAEEQ